MRTLSVSFVLLLLSLLLKPAASAQTITKIKEFKAKGVQSLTVDRLGNFFLIFKSGAIKKYDPDGKLLASLKGGKVIPTLVEPWYHPSIFVFDRPKQEWIVFDHDLKNPQITPVDPSVAIAPYLVCPTNDNKLLVFDKADNSVKKVSRFTNESLFEFTIDTTKLGKAPDFIFIREYQNMIFLLDRNSGIWVYNNIGRQVNFIQATDLTGFGFYGEEIFFFKDGGLTLFDLYTEKTRQIPLEKAYRQSYITDERVISIDNYSRVSLYQFIDIPKG
jgi:hypothetical protein